MQGNCKVWVFSVFKRGLSCFYETENSQSQVVKILLASLDFNLGGSGGCLAELLCVVSEDMSAYLRCADILFAEF